LSYCFEFDSENRILRGRFEGLVTDEKLKQFCRGMGEHYALTDSRGGVADFSAVTSLKLSSQTVVELANAEPAGPVQRQVIVAPSLQVLELARLFEAEGQHTRPNLHVVRSERKAWAILGIVEPRFKTWSK
jgi:hypothetical protein